MHSQSWVDEFLHVLQWTSARPKSGLCSSSRWSANRENDKVLPQPQRNDKLLSHISASTSGIQGRLICALRSRSQRSWLSPRSIPAIAMLHAAHGIHVPFIVLLPE